ncbi:MAG TPA: NB-ARC domain-containing protein, partial [Mycobacteriales bacterium]|nr:NB-ARC domain-containing protein [Mycobacteriales bacterium]
MLDPATAGSVAAAAGMPGVGKTALVVHAAHEAVRRGWFPGGVLRVDLRGHHPDGPRTALEALGVPLHALGVPAGQLPDTEEGRAAMLASKLADRAGAVLLIADDAADESQVEPLLPAVGNCTVLVTSRRTLDLAGARNVEVGVLSLRTAVELVGARLGRDDDRVGRESDPARRLASLCGRLPLALQIAASLLATEPGRPIAGLADELADERNRLTVLGSGDQRRRGVRAVVELSYRGLAADHRRLLRLLSANPQRRLDEYGRLQQLRGTPAYQDISTEAAAVLAGRTPDLIRPVLAALARAHLLEYPERPTAPPATASWTEDWHPEPPTAPPATASWTEDRHPERPTAPPATASWAEYWRMHDLVLLSIRELDDPLEDSGGTL